MEDIDKGRRRFLLRATTLLAGIGAIFSSIPFLASWAPSARTRALGGPVEADISHLRPGDMMTVEWRGKPIWVLNRSQNMLAHLEDHNNLLRDPNSVVDQQPSYATNEYRSLKPEYLVLVGICTHLGCVPTFKPNINEMGPGWPGGFFCPCHGSKFDLAGRVFKGVPAPINLEVPPYYFAAPALIVIGENPPHG